MLYSDQEDYWGSKKIWKGNDATYCANQDRIGKSQKFVKSWTTGKTGQLRLTN